MHLCSNKRRTLMTPLHLREQTVPGNSLNVSVMGHSKFVVDSYMSSVGAMFRLYEGLLTRCTQGLQAMQQLSGINVLVYYMPHTLTTDVGMDYRTSLHVGAGLANTYWVFSFIGVFWLDRMGRRQPLIWGAVVCGLCFLLVGSHMSSSSIDANVLAGRYPAG